MGCCDYPLCKYSRQETEEFLVHKSEQFSMADTNDDIGVHGAGTPEESADKMNFRSRRWGSSLPGLHTRDPLLGTPSTLAEILWRERKKIMPSLMATSLRWRTHSARTKIFNSPEKKLSGNSTCSLVITIRH